MRKLFLFWIMLMMGSLMQLHAQQVYVCGAVGGDGKPLGAKEKWLLRSADDKVYLLYDNGQPTEKPMHISFSIDILALSDGYDAVTSTDYVLPAFKSWGALKFSFNESGTYRIRVKDSAQKVLAETKIILTVDPNAPAPEVPVAEAPNQSAHAVESPLAARNRYYVNSTVKVALNKKGKLKEDKDNVFKYKKKGTVINFKLHNDKALYTANIIAEIIKTDNGQETVVEKPSYYVNPTSPDYSFDYTFHDKGHYKVNLYTKDKMLINTVTLVEGKK